MAEWEVIIKNRSKRTRKKLKTMVLPSKRAEVFGRRKSLPAITFYDCATLNGEDLRILKVPTYSIDPLNDPTFQGAVYTVETFGTSDFQNYYDQLFEVPVGEWKDNYRKLTYELNPDSAPNGGHAEPTTYPRSLAIRSPITSAFEDVFSDFSADITTPTGKTLRSDNFDDFGLCWDARGLEYRGLSDIKLRRATTQNRRDWFSMALTLSDYKVTATNDPDAPDVSGTLTVSGKIDIYLIPLVGMYIAASYNGPDVLAGHLYDGAEGVQILGPWYQAFPRANWFEYVDPFTTGSYPALFEDFIAYQKGRSGAQASQWFWDGGTGVTSSSMVPSDFRTGNLSWKSTIDNLELPDLYNGTASTFTDHTSREIFESSDPILMAVMKLHNHFYYIWSVGDTAIDEIDFVNIDLYTISVYPLGDEAP